MAGVGRTRRLGAHALALGRQEHRAGSLKACPFLLVIDIRLVLLWTREHIDALGAFPFVGQQHHAVAAAHVGQGIQPPGARALAEQIGPLFYRQGAPLLAVARGQGAEDAPFGVLVVASQGGETRGVVARAPAEEVYPAFVARRREIVLPSQHVGLHVGKTPQARRGLVLQVALREAHFRRRTYRKDSVAFAYRVGCNGLCRQGHTGCHQQHEEDFFHQCYLFRVNRRA